MATKKGSVGMIGKEHFGKWVAFSANRGEIVGYSADLKELSKKVGNRKVVYEKVLYPDRLYAF